MVEASTAVSPELARVQPIPEGFHALTPGLVLDGAARAIDYYVQVFGARELVRLPTPDGQRVWHAELQFGDSRLMIADPADGTNPVPTSAAGLLLYVEDADAVFQRALDTGASILTPIESTFWGDRFGRLRDPFGFEWGIATHVEDVPEEEQARRAKASGAS